jgi:sugar-specific transcriptional regulator TrmB
MSKPSYSYIELELQKLGLNKNEARIYLAALELGQSSVQKLAEKVGMSRPTVYRVLESLQKKELIEKIDRKKGGSVNPKSPDELLSLLRIKKRQIEEQEREFIRIISTLKTQHYTSNKNLFEIFDGSDGKKFILNDLSQANIKKIRVFFGSKSNIKPKELPAIYEKIRKRTGKIEVNELSTEQFPDCDYPYIKRKLISESLSPFSGALIIAHKIIYFHNNQIFCVEEESMIELVKSLFISLWRSNE